MRPSEPTSTGVATSSAFWLLLRCICSVYLTPSGPMRFHAQKVTAKAKVARARFRPWPLRPTCGGDGVDAVGALVLMGLLEAGSVGSVSAVAVGGADAAPAGPAGAVAGGPAVARPVDDVGPEEVVQRGREGVHEPREGPQREEQHPDDRVDVELHR